MQINKEGLNLVSILGVSSIVCALVFFPLLPFFFILLILTVWLNRDPDRVVVSDKNAVTSPVDGYVALIDEFQEENYFNTRVKRVSINRTPFDINVNRAPVGGVIEYQKFFSGNSFSDCDFQGSCQSCSAGMNHSCGTVMKRLGRVYFKNTLGIRGEHLKVLVSQKGLTLPGFALHWTDAGKKIDQGSRTGISGMYSKTELILPGNCRICVKQGQHVRGGLDIIAFSGE